MKGPSTACAVLENNDPSDSKSTQLGVCKQCLGGIPLILLILGLNRIILVRHTICNENKVYAPSSVTNLFIIVVIQKWMARRGRNMSRT
jgi:hypothetical protein